MRSFVAFLVVCACTDPKLSVRVDHEGVEVHHTKVSVYESGTLTCQDVAFQRIGPDELAAVLVAEETIDADGNTISGDLTNISRTDHKVIVARGYDATDAWITAGCDERDEIDGVVKVPITTMRTVTASVVPPDAAELDTLVAVTGIDGKGAAGRKVAWTLYGPAKSTAVTPAKVTMIDDGIWEPISTTCTLPSGFVRIRPTRPSVIGGFAVQARVMWATALPPMFTGFVNGELGVEPIVAPSLSPKYCALRVRGQMRELVCLNKPAANVFIRRFTVGVDAGKAVFTHIVPDTLTDPDAFAVLSVPDGTNRDVYVVTTTGNVIPYADAPDVFNPSTLACPTPADCRVDDALVAPPCSGAAGKLLVHLGRGTGPAPAYQLAQLESGTTSYTEYPRRLTMGTTQVLDNAGCVDRFDLLGGVTTQRQVVTIHEVENVSGVNVPVRSYASYACTTGTCAINPLVQGAGTTFTTGFEARLVIAGIDATGVVLSHVVLAPEGPQDQFIERARYPSAALPVRLVTGRFDDDDSTDLFWSLAGGGRRGTAFQVAYARDVGPSPLEAVSPVDAMTTTFGLTSGDVTGDGFDDLVIMGTAGVVQGVAVVPVYTTPPPPTGFVDMTCE